MRDCLKGIWQLTMILDPSVMIKGQENAYKEVVKTAVGGAAGVIHQVECRPVWKPMHKQPVYDGAAVYTNGVEEEVFKVGMCLPAGPYVSDEDVKYIVECIKEAIEK